MNRTCVLDFQEAHPRYVPVCAKCGRPLPFASPAWISDGCWTSLCPDCGWVLLAEVPRP